MLRGASGFHLFVFVHCGQFPHVGKISLGRHKFVYCILVNRSILPRDIHGQRGELVHVALSPIPVPPLVTVYHGGQKIRRLDRCLLTRRAHDDVVCCLKGRDLYEGVTAYRTYGNCPCRIETSIPVIQRRAYVISPLNNASQ